MTINEDDRSEAERLKLIPRGEQIAIVALHRSVANNPKAPAAERKEARRKAAALEQLLGLKKRKQSCTKS